jgi:pyruvate formate lyase activating enzyme
VQLGNTQTNGPMERQLIISKSVSSMGDVAEEYGSVEATVTNIQRYCIHDGPGVRSTVFLKGCPLRCPWCANPECLTAFPQLGFIQVLCNVCGICVASCPEGAITADSESGAISIDRARCSNCGKCIEVCYRGALKMYGCRMSVAEVFEEVVHDRPIYLRSGGGVTVSGGEPLLQHHFITALFKLARQAGMHTALETSLCVSPRILKEVLNCTDYVMFDLKLMDASSHHEVTGKANGPILKNIELLASSGLPVLPRMPLVPGVNDSEENIRATAQFLTSIGLPVIELMPYHRFASGKYAALGMPYTMADVGPPSGGKIREVKELFERFLIECRVSV